MKQSEKIIASLRCELKQSKASEIRLSLQVATLLDTVAKLRKANTRLRKKK